MDYITAGESHGPSLVALVRGVPAGLALSAQAINADLARRQSGYGRGGRMKIEVDQVRFMSGMRFGRTLGTPLAIEVANRDWENWRARMAHEGAPPHDLVRERSPRPGHADLVGALKNNTDDCRDVLERASARETAARVAAGAVARSFLASFGVEVRSYVCRIGDVEIPPEEVARKSGVFSADRVESSPVRCPHEEASRQMTAAIDEAREAGTSLGGWFSVTATGLVCGLGGFAEPRERLTARLGAALFSIPAIKGVEFGLGFAAGTLPGSRVHDEIVCTPDEPGRIQPARASNNAGGLEGGMSTGEPLVIRAAMKPIPTQAAPLRTVDLLTHELTLASKERSDICAVPACAVVAEAEVALVLADAYTEKFGHDNMADCLARFEAYVARVARVAR
ncbi:MAG: chorismate synthase [Coriobacteriales bacterium]|jgi:chorismate synthase|nr:chorismate synthase [Coriobacteriales bacterium]